MDPERAETHLRLVAEAELRRAVMSAGENVLPVLGYDPARVARVARTLTAVGAIDAATADPILAGFELAVTVRDPGPRQAPIGVRPPGTRRRLARLRQAAAYQATSGFTTTSPQQVRPNPPPTPYPAQAQAPDRAVPVGMMIPVRSDDVRGELYLLAFSQTASGARFTMTAWLRGGYREVAGPYPAMHMLDDLTATDDRGTSYTLGMRIGSRGGTGVTGQLNIHPDPPPGVRWLDLAAPGGATRRVSLDPPTPAPAITVTEVSRSPGEHLLHVIAARILTWSLAPLRVRHDAVFPPPERGGSHPTAGLGDVVEALQAAGALSLLSPVPGQLATLCESLDVRDHGITAPPAPDLPKPWLSVLARAQRKKPDTAVPSEGCAGAAIALPELDGVTVSILGLDTADDCTMLHVHATGVDPAAESDAGFLPVLWLRDDAGRWHAAQTTSWSTGHDGEAIAQLLIVPPLTRCASIDIIAAGRSAEVRTTLPLRWG